MISSHEPRDIVLLGSTGSIGTQTIDVVRRNRDRFRVRAISAGGGGSLDMLARQAIELGAEYVGIAAADRAHDLREALRAAAAHAGRAPGRLPEVVAGADASGSTLAQVAPPDIRMALALGMSWPDRVADAAPACDWSRASTWQFFPVDRDAFPGLGLACAAGAAGGTAPAVFNAANEECVSAFLGGRLPFLGIIDTVERVLAEHDTVAADELTLENVLTTEAWARQRTRQLTGLAA